MRNVMIYLTPCNLYIDGLFHVQNSIKKRKKIEKKKKQSSNRKTQSSSDNIGRTCIYVNRVMKKLLPPPPHPHPPVDTCMSAGWRVVKTRAESRGGWHAEGSANDMDVEWEIRDQQPSQTFEAGVDVGPLAVGGSIIFAWEQRCTRSLFHSAERVLQNCLVCL